MRFFSSTWRSTVGRGVTVVLVMAASTGAGARAQTAPAPEPSATPAYTTATLALLTAPDSPPAPVKYSATPPGAFDEWTVVYQAPMPAGSPQEFWSVVRAGGYFMAVGLNGTIVTSPDGIVWTKRDSNTMRTLFSAASNSRTYVAVGERGTITVSRDLEKWTSLPTIGTDRIYGVYWTGSQYVAVGDNAFIAISPDGLTWRAQATNGTGTYFHHGLWTGSQLMVTTSDGVETSPEGLRWSSVLATPSRMLAAATNGTMYVAVGQMPLPLFISRDGLRWSPGNPGFSANLSGAEWTGSEFIVTGDGGKFATSPDGVNWTVQAMNTTEDLHEIAANNRIVVMAKNPNELLINKKVAPLAAPQIMLAPGPAGSVPQVMLTGAAGAKLYYTLDGREPTERSAVYSAPFSPPTACQIKARAYGDGYLPSSVAVAEFVPRL